MMMTMMRAFSKKNFPCVEVGKNFFHVPTNQTIQNPSNCFNNAVNLIDLTLKQVLILILHLQYLMSLI